MIKCSMQYLAGIVPLASWETILALFESTITFLDHDLQRCKSVVVPIAESHGPERQASRARPPQA